MPTKLAESIDKEEAAVASIDNLPGRADMDLVAAAKNENREAFEVLVERHARRIFFAARRMTRTREDAEDVVQRSLQKAFIHLQEFAGKSAFSTWITRITINEALMLLRKGRGLREVPIDDANANEEAAPAPEVPDSGADPEVIYSQREREQILFLAVNELAPGMRRAIKLRDLEERSTAETARILGISVAAVKAQVLRGRKKLRERLKHFAEPFGASGSGTSRTISGTRYGSQDQVACNARG